MLGCPIGIDWTVEHVSRDRVRVADVVRYDTTDKDAGIRFPLANVELDRRAYAREVVAFAEHAKELFVGVAKEPFDEVARLDYERFWGEYDDLLVQAASSGER